MTNLIGKCTLYTTAASLETLNRVRQTKTVCVHCVSATFFRLYTYAAMMTEGFSYQQ